MVKDVIKERRYRQEKSTREVSAKWGESQTVLGLVLTVPYHSYTKVYDNDQKKYKLVKSREYAHFLPNELNITGNIHPEVRYRGIYEIIVYNSKLNLSGHFSTPNFEEWKIADENILWNEAYVSMGLSDLRGLQKRVVLNWNGEKIDFNPELNPMKLSIKELVAEYLRTKKQPNTCPKLLIGVGY